MIIQRNVLWVVVDMYRRNNHMRDACVVGEEWQQGVVAAIRIVDGLVIDDEPRTSRGSKQFGAARGHCEGVSVRRRRGEAGLGVLSWQLAVGSWQVAVGYQEPARGAFLHALGLKVGLDFVLRHCITATPSPFPSRHVSKVLVWLLVLMHHQSSLCLYYGRA